MSCVVQVVAVCRVWFRWLLCVVCGSGGCCVSCVVQVVAVGRVWFRWLLWVQVVVSRNACKTQDYS